MSNKIVYIDMDGVIVDFESGINKLSPDIRNEYFGRYEDVPGIFSLMKPMPDAIESVKKIAQKYEVFILSTAPWNNPTAWSDKVIWLQKYFGSDKNSPIYKKVILSHYKNLNQGNFLIDDRDAHGTNDFEGEFIKFGSESFPDWNSVLCYLDI